MTQGSLAKEMHKLLKTVGRVSEGQARVSDWDPDNVEKFVVEIKPSGGPYKGGTFNFEVTLGDDFPASYPSVRCQTPIYHPNIDPTDDSDDTNICLNMFSDEWQEAYGMDGVIQGLLFLFYHPNLEDPLSPYFDSTSVDEELFEENVLKSLKGEEVEGRDYEWNYYGTKEEHESEDKKDESETVGENEENKAKDMPEDQGSGKENTEAKQGKGDHFGGDVPVEEDKGDNSLSDVASGISQINICNNDTEANTEECQQTSEMILNVKESIIPSNQKNIEKSPFLPDILPVSGPGATGLSVPDIVTATLGSENQCKEFQYLKNMDKYSNAYLTRTEDQKKHGPLHTYDSLMPEIDVFFVMLNKVTESFKT